MPFVHFVGQLAEAFHCLPSEAWREYLRMPAGWLEDIIEGRAYVQAKAAYDAADTAEARKRLPMTPLVALAEVFDFEGAEEELAHGRPTHD